MTFTQLMFDTAVAPVFADAAQASSGADGLALAVGGSALGALVTLVCTWIKARHTRTEIAPDPLHTEQTSNQANWKDNARDHENIFARLSALEKATAAQGAEIKAQKDLCDRIFNMVTAIYDRIVCGGKRTK